MTDDMGLNGFITALLLGCAVYILLVLTRCLILLETLARRSELK